MRIHVTTSEAHLTSPDVPCKGVYNQAKAREIRADTINLGKVDLDEEAVYESMKVGQQVQK